MPWQRFRLASQAVCSHLRFLLQLRFGLASDGILAAQSGEKILEIGAGSGCAAAVLSEIAAQVYTVERLGQLAEKASAALADLGYDNVRVLHGDGTRVAGARPVRCHRRGGRRAAGS